jgi:hypothetical protein
MRALILFLALATWTGCSEKTPPGGDKGGDGSAAYVIKLRPPQEGDEAAITRSRSGNVTVTAGGKAKTQHQAERYQYTEKILEMPAGASKPIKANRTFKVAEKSDEKGKLQPLSYAGKTVEIMVSPIKDVGYIFIVGGNALQPPERDSFLEEFQGPKKPDLDSLLPKNAVRIGEEWAAPLSAVGAVIGGEMKFNLDNDKSKITSKLLRVYTKDGQQWGEVEMKIHMVIAPAGKGLPLSGTISAAVTLDAVIDGSSSARSIRMRLDGALSATDATGGKTTLEIQGEQAQSRTPVK